MRQKKVDDLKVALRAVPADGELAMALREQLQEAEKAVERHKPSGTQLDATRAYLVRAQKRAQLAVDHEVACQTALRAATEERMARQAEVRRTEQRIRALEETLAAPAAASHVSPPAPAMMQPAEAAPVRRLLAQVQTRLRGPTAATPPREASELPDAAMAAEGDSRPDRERSPRRRVAASPAGAESEAAPAPSDPLLQEISQLLQRLLPAETPVQAPAGPTRGVGDSDMEL